MPKSYRRNADEMLNNVCQKADAKNQMLITVCQKTDAKDQCTHDLSNISTDRESHEI